MEHLQIVDFGIEHCASDKASVMHPFNHHVLHFVFSGSGYLDGEKITAGSVFLCRGGENSVYVPNSADPWYYGWIGGSGVLFEQLISDMGFSDTCHVCTMRKHSLIEILIQLGTSSKEQEFRCGLFYAIAGLQIAQAQNTVLSAPEQHARNAEQFIESRSGAVTPLEVAQKVNLSRAYLRNIFFRIHGVSLQEYIIQFRMTRAAELLSSTNLPVSEIAAMVGYRDPLMFTKMFRHTRGQSPTEFRSSSQSFKTLLSEMIKIDPRYQGEPIEQLYHRFIAEK